MQLHSNDEFKVVGNFYGNQVGLEAEFFSPVDDGIVGVNV